MHTVPKVLQQDCLANTETEKHPKLWEILAMEGKSPDGSVPNRQEWNEFRNNNFT